MKSFRSVIELWPTRDAMALEVGATNWNVSKWWQRDSIPAEWWSSVTCCKTARHAGVTAALLANLAAREAVR